MEEISLAAYNHVEERIRRSLRSRSGVAIFRSASSQAKALNVPVGISGQGQSEARVAELPRSPPPERSAYRGVPQAVNVTGIVFQLLTRVECHRVGSPLTPMSGTRRISSSNIAEISARARLAPRQ